MEYKETYVIHTLILKAGHKLINTRSCSTQLSMNFNMLVNVKMPTALQRKTFGI